MLEQLLQQLVDGSGVDWKDETYDLANARCLSGSDREIYVAKLMENAAIGDSHAIMTLGNLPAPEALPMMMAAARGSDSWAGYARRAVTLLGRGADIVDLIAKAAVDSPDKTSMMARVAAVMDLATIGGAAAMTALSQALGDPEYQVRSLAWDGLIATLKLDPFIRNPAGERKMCTHIELMHTLLLSDLDAFVCMGVDGMRAIVLPLIAGSATPQSLGLAWTADPAPEVADALRLTLFELDTQFPLEAIAKQSGISRRWLETMIAFRLDYQDVRAPSALVKLGATWTLPGLEEAAGLEKTPPELLAELTPAIAALRQQLSDSRRDS